MFTPKTPDRGRIELEEAEELLLNAEEAIPRTAFLTGPIEALAVDSALKFAFVVAAIVAASLADSASFGMLLVEQRSSVKNQRGEKVAFFAGWGDWSNMNHVNLMFQNKLRVLDLVWKKWIDRILDDIQPTFPSGPPLCRLS